MRLFGLPLQFLVVVVVSAALAIFFGAWAADARVEARAQDLSLSSIRSLYVESYAAGGLYSNAPSEMPSPGVREAAVQPQGWEKAFLYACPLH
jgi:hypothetical protein